MSLNLYSPWQEEHVSIRNEVRTWKRSGLLDDDQLREMVDSTDPGLRLTNPFFRALFFVFACLCAGTIVALYAWLTDTEGTLAFAVTFVVAAVGFYLLAEYAVQRYGLYRHGLEEALAMSAVVLVSAGLYLGAEKLVFARDAWRSHAIFLCLCVAASAGWIHLRFGYLYSAIISLAALCIIPFLLGLAPSAERALLLALLCLIFFLSARFDKPEGEEFRKERRTTIQAWLLVGIYFTVNLHIVRLVSSIISDTGVVSPHPLVFGFLRDLKSFPTYVYWTSYALTFLVPAAGISWGVARRKRLIIDASLIFALLTLATNKSYLGWERYAWDPAILGALLVAVTLVVRQWLAGGPEGTRSGFTEKEILKPEPQGITAADAAAALAPGLVDTRQPEPQPGTSFDGGKSGGGGAARGI